MLSLCLSCCVSYEVGIGERDTMRTWDRLVCWQLLDLLITVIHYISNDPMRPSVYLSSSLLFSFSILAANFPCLAHVSRLLLSSFIKKNDLDVLHSTALGLVKARRQEGKSKVGISLSLPEKKKRKVAEISLKLFFQGVMAFWSGTQPSNCAAGQKHFIVKGGPDPFNLSVYAHLRFKWIASGLVYASYII